MKNPHPKKSTKELLSLSPETQIIVNTLAVFYGYSSMTNLATCLAHLGVKHNNKELNPKLLRNHFDPVLKTGVLEEPEKGGGGVRCARALAEVIVRKLVAEGQFEKYADAIERHNPMLVGYRGYAAPDQYLRNARIAFYRGKNEEMNKTLSMASHYISDFPSGDDVLLSWFLNPLDIEWSKNHQQKFLGGLLEYAALHQLLYL